MGSSDGTSLGDRMKEYEFEQTTRKAMRGLPLLARLDGRAFHTYTRGLNKPFDDAMIRCMVETMRYLVQETHALVGYTQSDEITLLWYVDEDSKSQYLFDGKYQKLVSVLASMATLKFNKMAEDNLKSKTNQMPVFDCRVWQVPSQAEAANVFLWRELDATKNAISMAASSKFSPKDLHGKTGKQKQEMLCSVYGVNFNDYPARFKRGTYAKRYLVEYECHPENLPEKHNAVLNDNGNYTVRRTEVNLMDMPKVTSIANYEEVLFTKLVDHNMKIVLRTGETA